MDKKKHFYLTDEQLKAFNEQINEQILNGVPSETTLKGVSGYFPEGIDHLRKYVNAFSTHDQPPLLEPEPVNPDYPDMGMKAPDEISNGAMIDSSALLLIGNVQNPQNERVIPSELFELLNKKQPKKDKIGIGITTHNREEIFTTSFMNIVNRLPENVEIVVVDDASQDEYVSSIIGPMVMRHTFDTNVGIARAKNKCLELLYDAGCEHFFLFDDDTYPDCENWWKPYVESREPHLMYIFQHFSSGKSPNDMILLYQDNEVAAYSHVRGCMLYYKRICLDVVGGMDVAFGKWGHEHGDLSNRIYSAGLTRFRYMDVPFSAGLFYSADEREHGTFKSTVPGAQRIDYLNKTKAIYDAQYNSPAFRPFWQPPVNDSKCEAKPLFLTAYFTTIPDPQRPNEPMRGFFTPDFSNYAGSIIAQKSDCIILIDNPVPDMDTAYVKLKTTQVSINPYFQRWISYYEYLIKHKNEISWVFMTDCTDVELLNMPVPERGKIYVGDEPGIIGGSQWLHYHHRHPDLILFYRQYGRVHMVNAGILGGYIDDVLPFVRAIIDTYSRMSHDSMVRRTNGPGMTDMGIFNYVAHTMFPDKISHGKHVNTTFKANERNDISWFKHK